MKFTTTKVTSDPVLVATITPARLSAHGHDIRYGAPVVAAAEGGAGVLLVNSGAVTILIDVTVRPNAIEPAAPTFETPLALPAGATLHLPRADARVVMVWAATSDDSPEGEISCWTPQHE